MVASTVRYVLVLLLIWPLAWCPGTASADPGPAVSEPSVVAVDDLATLSLRYRAQLDETIRSLALCMADVEAFSLVAQPLPSRQSPPEDTGVCRTPSVYALMSLLR